MCEFYINFRYNRLLTKKLVYIYTNQMKNLVHKTGLHIRCVEYINYYLCPNC